MKCKVRFYTENHVIEHILYIDQLVDFERWFNEPDSEIIIGSFGVEITTKPLFSLDNEMGFKTGSVRAYQVVDTYDE